MSLGKIIHHHLSSPNPWSDHEINEISVGADVLVKSEMINVTSYFGIEVYRTGKVIAEQKTGWKVDITGIDSTVRFSKNGVEIGGRRILYVFRHGSSKEREEAIKAMRSSEDAPLIIEPNNDTTDHYKKVAEELKEIHDMLSGVYIYPSSKKLSTSGFNPLLQSLLLDDAKRKETLRQIRYIKSLAMKKPDNE